MTYSYTQISQYLTCPRRYRHRYLDGWKEKDTRAAMLFGRAFETALGALFRREDPGAVLFTEWSACQSQDLHYSNRDSWDRMLRQGLMLLTRFCQDNRVQVLQPERNLQIKFTRPVGGKNDFVAYIDAIGKLDGKRCLLEWKTSFQPIPGRTRGTAVSGSAAGLLLVDYGYCGSRPGGLRPQEPGRGSVPAHHDHRRTAPGVWPPGGRHDPSNRIGGLSGPQRYPLSPESLQHLSVCGSLSRKAGNDRRCRRAASRSRQS